MAKLSAISETLAEFRAKIQYQAKLTDHEWICSEDNLPHCKWCGEATVGFTQWSDGTWWVRLPMETV